MQEFDLAPVKPVSQLFFTHVQHGFSCAETTATRARTAKILAIIVTGVVRWIGMEVKG